MDATNTYLDGEDARNRAQQNASGRDNNRKLHGQRFEGQKMRGRCMHEHLDKIG